MTTKKTAKRAPKPTEAEKTLGPLISRTLDVEEFRELLAKIDPDVVRTRLAELLILSSEFARHLDIDLPQLIDAVMCAHAEVNGYDVTTIGDMPTDPKEIN